MTSPGRSVPGWTRKPLPCGEPGPLRAGGAGHADPDPGERRLDEGGAVPRVRAVRAHDVGVAGLAPGPLQQLPHPVAGQRRQGRVTAAAAVDGRGVASGRVAEDDAAAVRVGVVQDVVDVPGGVVVGVQRLGDAVGSVGDAGAHEVVRGGGDAVGVVADVGATVAVAVDAHRRERGRHELHEALGAGARGGGGAAVPGLLHADAGEQRPRDRVPSRPRPRRAS